MNDYVKAYCTIKKGDSRFRGNDRNTKKNVIPLHKGIL